MRKNWLLRYLTDVRRRCYNSPTQQKEQPCPYAAIGEDTLPGGLKF